MGPDRHPLLHGARAVVRAPEGNCLGARPPCRRPASWRRARPSPLPFLHAPRKYSVRAPTDFPYRPPPTPHPHPLDPLRSTTRPWTCGPWASCATCSSPASAPFTTRHAAPPALPPRPEPSTTRHATRARARPCHCCTLHALALAPPRSPRVTISVPPCGTARTARRRRG